MYAPDELRERLLRTLAPPVGLAEALSATPAGTRPAAVLVPLLGAGDSVRLVFTKRTDTLSRHAGEISFPGGMLDADEEPAAAALREAEEELGLAPHDVELLGALEPVHTHVTAILIQPFVGWLATDPAFTPNAREIDRVLEYRLDDLIARAGERMLEHDGRRFTTHVYDMPDGHTIWGATGRILRTFTDVLLGRATREEFAR